MTNKNTKRALFSSALALLLCMAMLVGTTYAWFTDSASSGINTIQSGNLDVVLEYTTDGENWAEVTSDVALFDDAALWEPGHVESVVLRVKNAGTLALKYNLNTTVFSEIGSVNVYGREFKLSDYLTVKGLVYGVDALGADYMIDNFVTSRDPWFILNDYDFGENFAEDQFLAAGAGHYLFLSIAMPTDVGNEANYKTGEAAPSITFGVNLLATQAPIESDSFDHKYDASAEYPELPTPSITTLDVSTLPLISPANGDGTTTYALDTAYNYAATDSEEAVEDNMYKYWHADFVVSFNKPVKAGTVGLAGQYDTWSSDWLGFLNPTDMAAGESIRLLDYVDISMNYEEMCTLVKEFKCGAFDVNGQNAGTTMTVELRMYETEGDPTISTGSKNIETGKYVVVNSTTYTF